MKNYYLLLFLFAFLVSCEKDDLQVIEPELQTSVLPTGNYNTISESDWEELIKNYSPLDSNDGLKSTTTFESMWDVLMELDGLAGDSTKVDEYKKLADKHSKILKGNSTVGYDLITSSALIAKSFSSDGLLKIGDKIYEIQPNQFVEYTGNSEEGYQAVAVERKIEIFAPNTASSLKSVFWQSPTLEHKFSSSRKVKVYLFRETIPNSSLSIFGAYSKYYKKSWGSWREHKSRNGIILNFRLGGVPKICEDILYYPGQFPPDRSTMVAEAIDYFNVATTDVMVRYYRHPDKDYYLLVDADVTWYGSHFGL